MACRRPGIWAGTVSSNVCACVCTLHPAPQRLACQRGRNKDGFAHSAGRCGQGAATWQPAGAAQAEQGGGRNQQGAHDAAHLVAFLQDSSSSARGVH